MGCGADKGVEEPTSRATAEAEVVNPLVAAVRESLRARNPAIQHATIIELRKHFWAPDRVAVMLGYGFRERITLDVRWEDELFGVFLTNPSLTRITHTLDVFSTLRWRDYSIHIERMDGDSLVIRGQGITHGDAVMERRYAWPKVYE